MNKIVLLFLVSIFGIHSAREVKAADGFCGQLLSEQIFSAEDQLSIYLRELFSEGVVTAQELDTFRSALLRGECINPIKSHELDINRYIAFERIQELIAQNPDKESLLPLVTQIIDQKSTLSLIEETVNEDTAGLMVLVKTGDLRERRNLIKNYFSKSESVKDYKALEVLIARTTDIEGIELLIEYVFSKNYWSSHPELLNIAIKTASPSRMYLFARKVFSEQHWSIYPELLKFAIEKTPEVDVENYAMFVFANEYWSNQPELLRLAIEKTPADRVHEYGVCVFSKEHWANHPELLRLVIKKTPADKMDHHAISVFSRINWLLHPELLRLAIKKTDPYKMHYFIDHVFSKEHWSAHPELLRLAVEMTTDIYMHWYTEDVFLKEYWSSHQELRAALDIEDLEKRSQILRTKLGPYSWEGTEQENLEEYLNTLYGRINE